MMKTTAVLALALLASACGVEEATPIPTLEATAMSAPRITATATTGPAPAAQITIQYAPDGTPIYAQANVLWKSRVMSGTTTISQAGGALCSVAMCLARFAGINKIPTTVDIQLDTNAGYYNGVAIRWDVAAALLPGYSAQQSIFSLSAVDAELDAAKPVVVGVSTDGGATLAGATGTWVAVTSKGLDSEGAIYNAVDPATGEVLALRASGGALVGGPRNYTTTSELVTFTQPTP